MSTPILTKFLIWRVKKTLSFIENWADRCQSIIQLQTFAEIYSRTLIKNDLGIYRNDYFEKKALSFKDKTTEEIFSVDYGRNGGNEIHLISEYLKTGGHSRLLSKLIAMRPNSDILISRPINSSEVVGLRSESSSNGNIIYSENGISLGNLTKILLDYQHVFLHIHPDDFIAAASVFIAKTTKNFRVYFVNHADHLFSFGFATVDYALEVSAYGYCLNKKKRKVKSSFLGIPLANCNIITSCETITWSNQPIRLAMAGDGWKFKPIRGMSIHKELSTLLKNNRNISVMVIGPNVFTDWWWWSVKLKNIHRLKIFQKIHFNTFNALISSADLYLDSYPITGGTTLPQVRLQNTVVSGLYCCTSGYSPLDQLRRSSLSTIINELQLIVDQNNAPDLIHNTKIWHSPESINNRLDILVNQNIESNLPSLDPISSICLDCYTVSYQHRIFFNCSGSLIKNLASISVHSPLKLIIILGLLPEIVIINIPIILARVITKKVHTLINGAFKK